MHAPITQTFKQFVGSVETVIHNITSSHSTSSHYKSHYKLTDRHRHKYHNRDTKHKAMVITTERNHTVKIHTMKYITIDTTILQGSMK